MSRSALGAGSPATLPVHVHENCEALDLLHRAEPHRLSKSQAFNYRPGAGAISWTSQYLCQSDSVIVLLECRIARSWQRISHL